MVKVKNLSYRYDIDGLRAISIFFVLIFHAWPEIIPGGFIGVDIFFVVSGYLISGIIISQIDNDTFSFQDFYLKRIRRIFPSLVIVLTFVLLFGWFTLLPEEYAQIGKHIASGAIFISNFTLLKESGYFDISSDLKPLLHLWSLAIEEQFYLFWPPILYLTWKFRKTYTYIILTFLILGSFLFNFRLNTIDPIFNFYSPITRCWELLLGAGLALLQGDQTSNLPLILRKIAANNRFNIRNQVSSAGLFLILIGGFIFSKQSNFPSWRATLPTLGAIFIISAGPNAYINKRILSHKILVFLGAISYPLYLWHWPILSFIKILFHDTISKNNYDLLVLLSTFCSFFLAWATYVYIEKPIRKINGLELNNIAIKLLIGLTLLGSFGIFCNTRNGFEFRNSNYSGLYKSKTPFKVEEKSLLICQERFINSEICSLHDPSKSPTILLIGDSHANHFYPALSKYFAEKGENVLLLARSGVPPLYNVGSKRPQWTNNDDLFKLAFNNKSIHTIILSAFWDNYIQEQGAFTGSDFYKNIIYDIKDPTDANQKNIFVRGLDTTLQEILKLNKKVLFIYDIPYLSFQLRSCIPRPYFFREDSKCTLSYSKFKNENSFYREAVKEVLAKYPEVQSFDPSHFLCNKDYCKIKQADLFLYSDEHHLSIDGSLFLSKYFTF